MKKLVFALSLLLYAISLKAQLFHTAKLYPPNSYIRSAFFNGSGGKGYWSTEKTDSLGRVVEENIFQKKVLLSANVYTYNDQNDLLYTIETHDTNHPGKIDTTRYTYTYQQQHIQYQRIVYGNHCADIFQLTAHHDNVWSYHATSYDQENKPLPAAAYDYVLTYDNGLLVKKVQTHTDSSVTTTSKEYYPNGHLKRRKIERVPEWPGGNVYVGGPGSDDQRYEYTYDKHGYIKKLYTIVNGKTYKIAVYRYSSAK